MSNAPTTPTPWQDRWHQPTLEDLLKGLKDHQRRNFEILMAIMDEQPPLQQSIIWYGSSWNWTIQYLWFDEQGTQRDQFAYFIANVEQPIICIPMAEEFIDRLPLRRLSKFVRDGVRSAKCAVELNWGTWTPGPESEANQLADLVKRKIKYLNKTPDED